MNLIKRRYGNSQPRTFCHMDKLLELDPVSRTNAKHLRDLFQKIKVNVRASKATCILEYRAEPLLIPIL